METVGKLSGALAVFALSIAFSGNVLGEHVDPAPVPDEVVQNLYKKLHVNEPTDPLPNALNQQMDETDSLLSQVELHSKDNQGAQSWATQQMLLSGAIKQFELLRGEFRNRFGQAHAPLPPTGSSQTESPHSANTMPFSLQGMVDQRFDRMLSVLRAVVQAPNPGECRHAIAQARKALFDLHGKFREQDRRPASASPIPTFTQGKPTKFKPGDFKKAPEPRYLASRVPGNNVYAFLGNTLLAALPDPTPAEAQTTCGYQPADLGESQEVQITDEIKALAQKLDYSPVKIYQYVSNEIQFEPYYGSMKGTMGTLYSKSGNATDQASLLIALLRASKIPARYVLGAVQFQNDPRVLRWIGAKDYAGAGEILKAGQIPTDYDAASKYIWFNHVWVEACVPYGNYRGAMADKTGNRWIPLDPSFKEKTYQSGIAVNVDFNYDDYMAKRTNGPDSLPQEYYAKQIEDAAKELAPNYANNTLKDVPYSGMQIPRKLDILPASLPYQVLNFISWGSGLTAETAEVPDSHRLKFEISATGFSSPVKLSMPKVALKRVTLSYRGATATDQANFDQLLNPPLVTASYQYLTLPQLELIEGVCSSGWYYVNGYLQCSASSYNFRPVNLVPVIKVDGTDYQIGNPVNMRGITSWANSNGAISTSPSGAPLFVDINLKTRVTQNEGQLNAADFSGKYKMYDIFALEAFAYQASDRLLMERVARLLATIKNATDPKNDIDETAGEFLHIAGLKYMRYVADSMKRIGEWNGGSGLSGNHLGLAATIVKPTYLFDLPFALSFSSTYPTGTYADLIDRGSIATYGVSFPLFPGFSHGLVVDFPGGLSRDRDLTTGQPNWKAFLLSGYAASAYESYIWQENARLDAVSTVRGLQYASETSIPILKINSANQATELPKLTSNATLNYTPGQLNQINTLLSQGYTLTMPRSQIQYSNWAGPVWVSEKNSGGDMEAGFTISGTYAGGYSVGSFMDNFYNPTLNTGFNISSPSFSSNAYNSYSYSYVPPPTINSWVGLGASLGNTYEGDPVNMVTGNMYHTERDINIKGRGGLNIVFERHYNSRATADGPLGYGWTHTFNHYLTFKDTNSNGITSSVSWVDGTGSEKLIQVNGASAGVLVGATFTPPQGYYFTTARNGDGTYTIKEKSGLIYTFESVQGTPGQKAKLISISDRNGNKLTLNYSGNNLMSVTDGTGHAISFTYDGASPVNHITQIQDWTGRSFQYGYTDGNKNLNYYKNPLAVSSSKLPISYAYYSAGDGTNLDHAMKSYTLPNGNGMTFEYYMNGRVFRHYNTAGETVMFTYNDFRNETVTVNERGYERHFFFDANANPIKIVEENGAVREYTYDTVNVFNRLKERTPEGYEIQYAYDAQGNVIKVTNPSGATVESSYFDPVSGLAGKVKDARGNYTLYRYDTKGNRTYEINLKNGVGASIDPTQYTPSANDLVAFTINGYDNYGNLLSRKRVRNFATLDGPTFTYTYDPQGLNATAIKRSGDKDGNGVIDPGTEFDSAALHYDSLDRPDTVVDADWYAKTILYDSTDRIKTVTEATNVSAASNIRSYYYDDNGNVTQVDINNYPVSSPVALVDRKLAHYDQSDRKASSINAGGGVTSYEYDASGNVVRITNPDNYSLAFEYDANNHVTKAYDQENHAVSRELDLSGKIRSITDPNGNVTRYEYYDKTRDGRLKKITDPVGRVTTYDYDVNGNTTSVTDNLGRSTTTAYDELNRPVRIVGPAYSDAVYGLIRPVTRYAYDNLGNLTQVRSGHTDSTGTNAASDNVVTQMAAAYDDFGRKLSETDALGKTRTYIYDANNNVIKATDAKGQVTQFTWGYAHQLMSRSDAKGTTTTYTRNAIGQVMIAHTAAVNYYNDYDAAHRLKSVTDSRGHKTLNYAYSPGGLLNTLTDSDGKRTDYIYDPVGRLIGIWAPNDDYVSFTYDAGGRLTEKWFPNGVNTQYAWNADNTLSQVMNRMAYSNTYTLSQHDYTYDEIGNRKTYTDSIMYGGSIPYTYAYDELSRLTKVTNNATSVSVNYTYDPLGNRTQTNNGTVTQAYLYDDANQLKEIHQTDASGTLLSAFVYDANGNLVGKCGGTGVTRTDAACTGSTITSLAYNALDQLAQVAKTGQDTQTYLYDDQGRRIAKVVGGGTNEQYLYNGEDIYGDYSSSWSAASALYTDGPNTDDPLIRQTATGAQYYHADGLGSIVAMTSDLAGNAIYGLARYDVSGNASSAPGLAPIPKYGYTGREPDETGFIYYRARYYDPSIGRFTQRDPTGLSGGLNQYAYAGNNPVNYTDPTGTTAISRGVQGLIADYNSYYNQANRAFGVGGFTSSSQSLAAVHYRDQNTTENVQTALNLASMIPGVGSVAALASAAIDLDAGRYGSAALGVASAIPFVGAVGSIARTAGRTADVLLDVARVERGAAEIRSGSFSIVDWSGYPASVPMPQGPFRLLEGSEFNAARDAANAANSAIRRQQGLVGMPVDVHEVNPVKFGGSPTDLANKVVLPRDVHRQQVTPWWNQLQRDISSP